MRTLYLWNTMKWKWEWKLRKTVYRRGLIHGWDLRCGQEAFVFPVRPELGSATCLTVGPDRNWIAAGTNKGYIGLWDIRFNVMSKLWRHSSGSPMQRIARCKAIPRSHRHVMQVRCLDCFFFYLLCLFVCLFVYFSFFLSSFFFFLFSFLVDFECAVKICLSTNFFKLNSRENYCIY